MMKHEREETLFDEWPCPECRSQDVSAPHPNPEAQHLGESGINDEVKSVGWRSTEPDFWIREVSDAQIAEARSCVPGDWTDHDVAAFIIQDVQQDARKKMEEYEDVMATEQEEREVIERRSVKHTSRDCPDEFKENLRKR